MDEESIGFIIGPRLNAVGRLEDAGPGAELMLSFDEEKIAELVAYIQEKNVERQSIVQSIHEEARIQLAKNENLPDVVVLGNKNWHQGVLGIVASKLVEEFGRPTVLFNIDEKPVSRKGQPAAPRRWTFMLHWQMQRIRLRSSVGTKWQQA